VRPIAGVGDDGSLEPVEPVDPQGRPVEPVLEIRARLHQGS
jgi:hypothetical protein